MPELTVPKATSSVQDTGAEQPPFGSRFLTDEDDVWSQNAWDHVPPPDGQAESIAKALSKQRQTPVPVEEKTKYNEKPAKHWDNFYKMNASNFFRNRKWLHNEFPELIAGTQAGAGPFVITEIGCGAGNSVFPLLSGNENPGLTLHAYDYSHHAVKLVQQDPLYTSPPLGSISASVWDLSSKEGIPPDIQPGTVDIVILVFVLSALHPDEWRQAVNNIYKMLKPGGLVVFRDYGRYDLTQLRFKGGRMLDDNFYIRGDKTRVYFFELDELSLLFSGQKVSPTQQTYNQIQILDDEVADNESSDNIEDSTSKLSLSEISLEPSSSATASVSPVTGSQSQPTSSIHPNVLSPEEASRHPLFTTEQLGVDRRLIVNRKRQLKMYRVWMQAKFRKISGET